MVSAAELQRLHEQANGANNASVALGGQAGAPMADPFPSLSEDPFPAAKPVDTNGSAAGVVGAARQGSKANTQSSQPDLYVCIPQTAPVFIAVPNAFVLLSLPSSALLNRLFLLLALRALLPKVSGAEDLRLQQLPLSLPLQEPQRHGLVLYLSSSELSSRSRSPSLSTRLPTPRLVRP